MRRPATIFRKPKRVQKQPATTPSVIKAFAYSFNVSPEWTRIGSNPSSILTETGTALGRDCKTPCAPRSSNTWPNVHPQNPPQDKREPPSCQRYCMPNSDMRIQTDLFVPWSEFAVMPNTTYNNYLYYHLLQIAAGGGADD